MLSLMKRKLYGYLETDCVVVCAFELKRQFGLDGLRRFIRCSAIAVGFGALIILAINEWIPSRHLYTIAVYAQTVGLFPQIPDIQRDVVPLWADSPGYFALAWMVSLVLTWARIYIPLRLACSINEDKRSGQAEMIALSQLSRYHVVTGKLLAPILSVGAVATVSILLLSGPSSINVGFLLPLRIWFDVILQLFAVAALCAAVASVSSPPLVLACTSISSMVGVSALFGACRIAREQLVLYSTVAHDWFVIHQCSWNRSFHPISADQIVCQWIPLTRIIHQAD